MPSRLPTPPPTALIELDGTASENSGNGELQYAWVQLEGPHVELSDPTAAKPYFRTGKPGLYRFQLVVSAGELKSDPFVVEIMIEQENQPPVAKLPREVGGEVGKNLEIDARDSYDPEGANLSYRWRFLADDPGGLEPDLLAHPVLKFLPARDGVYELELVVSDGENASPPKITRLYIKPRPKPPVAKARAVAMELPTILADEQSLTPSEGARPIARIEGPAVGKVGEKILLDARGSRSASERTLSYLWSQKSGPFVEEYEMVYNGAAERFLAPRSGDYEFELIVSDGILESDPAIHRLRAVNSSEPPVAVVVAPEKAMPGALVKLDATRSYDLEGSRLTYRWRQTGGPKVTNYLIDENLGDAAPAFHPPAPGTYTFELVVSNGTLDSRPVSIDIEVGEQVAPVTIAVKGPLVTGVGVPITLSANITGPSNKRVFLNWRQVEGPPGVNGKPDGNNLSMVLPQPGRYIFDVTALENEKVVATARQTIEAFDASSQLPIPPPLPEGTAPSPDRAELTPPPLPTPQLAAPPPAIPPQVAL
ncbi:MAG: hypothetical protein LBU79_00495, partial [Planctomycetota bacterium]|nr:hypothetical protein [Planctomycetota bacterium]